MRRTSTVVANDLLCLGAHVGNRCDKIGTELRKGPGQASCVSSVSTMLTKALDGSLAQHAGVKLPR